MLNYWVAIGILVVLVITSKKVPAFKLHVEGLIEKASNEDDIVKLKKILNWSRLLLVVITLLMVYMLACLVKFIASFF